MSKRRASMREGPLADLFRATDETEIGAPAAAAGAPAPAAVPAEIEEEPLPPPTPLPVRDALPFTPAARAASSFLASIRVVGVGGAGMNAVARMIETDLRGVEFVAVNTDAQQLAMSDATVKVALGREQTRGLGAGGDYELGKRVAEAGSDRLREALRGSDMVFVAVGEGGGTGSGAAPVVARLARELGALTVAIVTMPFGFEGSRRQVAADLGLERLAAEVDTVIVVPNDRLLQVLDRGTSMIDAFRVADDVLRQGVQGICDLITRPGLINLDFADVRTVMQTSGNALMGVGMASGATRGVDAATRAIASPLLGREIRGASGIVLSIAGGDDLGLVEVTEAAKIVREAATADANIIFGASVDPDLTGQFWVTVIATGFDGDGETVVAQQPTMTTGNPTGSWRRERPAAPRNTGAPKFEVSDDLDVPAFLRNR
jgi:cell division protein FtsZ